MKALKLINDNRMLTAGIITLIFVIFFGVIGSWFVDRERADVGAGRPAQPPSLDHWRGTDQQGRDVFADIVYGTPGTLKIGLIAAFVGV